jgi:phosphohistidine phosphatase
LTGRGRRDAPAVGRWLSAQVPPIDLVLCSPAARAVQTWDLAATQLDPTPQVRHDQRLYDASADDLLAVTRELPSTASTVVLVGHNPGLEDFLQLLTGAVQLLKTSAIAVMTTPATWAEAPTESWALKAQATPRGGQNPG